MSDPGYQGGPPPPPQPLPQPQPRKNPGNTVRAVILFDLPKGDRAVKAELELHDSAFSGGVTVSLAH